ncbi:MAG: hypothetical protein KC766_36225, partial [Myxococcales bacterium]|nr:hypothetical protein [Myxococcales bacterium]
MDRPQAGDRLQEDLQEHLRPARRQGLRLRRPLAGVRRQRLPTDHRRELRRLGPHQTRHLWLVAGDRRLTIPSA